MKSADYWQKRFTAVENMNHSKAVQAVQSVTPAFDKAQRQIDSEINAWYQRYANNNQISLREAKISLNAKELKELRWDIDEYIKYGHDNAIDPRWMKQLENASARTHISRLEALQIRTQQAAEAAFGTERTALIDTAKEVFTEDYFRSAYEIQKGIGIGWDIGTLDNARLDRIIQKPWTADGMTFSDKIWKAKNQLVSQVHTELTQMCILGKGPDDAIKRISKLCDGNKSQAGRLIMTESAYFASEGQKECFNDLGVEKYEVVATLDSHTSEICQQMDGHVDDMKNFQAGVTAPPFHPWCRSTTVPYFPDNYGERAARNEKGETYYVPSDIKYGDWKKSFVDAKPETKEDLHKIVPDVKIKDKETVKSKTRESLEVAKVEYREVQPLEKELSIQEIIDKIGGGDLTKGSCSSLAFTYAGNRNGLDVLDFRDGMSRKIFSHNGNIKEITQLAGGQVAKNYNDFKAVNELLQNVVEGKEYYLATGSHAAIIRKVEESYEWLELQSPINNGWHKLTNDVLKRRFGCKKSHSVQGFKLEVNNELIDVEALGKLDEFEKLLGYINTAVDAQRKGISGNVK